MCDSKFITTEEQAYDCADLFRIGYLCGWAQGWGYATSPWAAPKAKELIYLRRVRELLNVFNGSEREGLLERWHDMYLEELDMYVRFSDGEAEDGDQL